MGDGVDASQEEVHIVGLARAQGRRQLAADKVCEGRRGEIRVIAHRVELGVGLDVFGELNCVSGLSRVRHERVLVERSGLVVGGLEDRHAAHGGFGRRDQGKVLACDSEKDLPVASSARGKQEGVVRHTSLRLVGIGRGSCRYRSGGAVNVEMGGGDKLQMAALLATGSVRLELSQAWETPARRATGASAWARASTRELDQNVGLEPGLGSLIDWRIAPVDPPRRSLFFLGEAGLQEISIAVQCSPKARQREARHPLQAVQPPPKLPTMPSYFTTPGAQKKRKRPEASEAPKKRLAASSKAGPKSSAAASRAPPSSRSAPAARKKPAERDESISGSDLDSDVSDVDLPDRDDSSGDSEDEAETAAEKRLRLAQQYLEKTKQEVEEQDEYAFDAEEIDRDLLAERLIEDVAETKGKVYRHLAAELDFLHADHTQFRWNSGSVTSVAVCAPYAYTTTKDGQLTKWKIQDLPKDQWPQTTKKKPKKPPAPPKRKPERLLSTKPNLRQAKDKSYQGHTGGALLTVRASQDGQFVVTGGADKRIVVHSTTDLRPLRAFTHHRDAVTGLAFRRGTNQLFSCSADRTVKVWSLDEFAYIETLFGHQDAILDVDALAGERCVSVGARDRTARYWKVPEESQLVFRGGQGGEKKAPTTTKIPKASAAHPGSLDRVAMIDDDMFVTAADNGDVALWNVNRKKAVFVVPCAHGLEDPLTPEQTSADAEPDPKQVPAPQPRAVTALRTIPYADVVLTGSWDGSVRVWRLSEDKKRLEVVGVLGEEEGLVRGVVNDIAVFERGERGKDGLCVVVATGKELRLGRWKVVKEGRCGAMVFEVPRVGKGKVNEEDVEAEE